MDHNAQWLRLSVLYSPALYVCVCDPDQTIQVLPHKSTNYHILKDSVYYLKQIEIKLNSLHNHNVADSYWALTLLLCGLIRLSLSLSLFYFQSVTVLN